MEYAEIAGLKEEAIELKRQGCFKESRDIYHRILKEFPDEIDTYKGLSKTEMAAGRYAEAARATLTKIELFASHSYASRRVLFDLQIANENLDWLYGSVVINGIRTVPDAIRRLVDATVCGKNAVLLASRELDPYLILGHCYFALFPTHFLAYNIPFSLLLNYRTVLGGGYSGPDVREYPEYNRIFHFAGVLLAMNNVMNTPYLAALSKDDILSRADKAINWDITCAQRQN
jgi:hypothetical protein